MQKSLVAIILHQCFKMVLYPDQIGLVQKYKAGLKLEKKNVYYIIMSTTLTV